MSATLLDDAFAHHVWATTTLLDTCSDLAPEQLAAQVPGTYGSIAETFRHLVASDRWYLSFFPSGQHLEPVDEEADVDLDALRSVMAANGAAWTQLLVEPLAPDADVAELGDGWEFHAPLGLRLAQAVHHGTDHRSQICTALTSIGVTPPEIDLWDFGEATGRTRSVSKSGA